MKVSKTFTPWVLLVFLWGFTLVHFGDLPDRVPIHYDVLGKPDRYGSQSYVWGLPLLASILLIILASFQKRMPLKEMEKEILGWLKISILLIFGYIQFQSFLIALGRSNGLGPWFLPLSVALTLVPLLFSLKKFKK